MSMDDIVRHIAASNPDIARDTLRRDLSKLLVFGFTEMTPETPPYICITSAGQAALKQWRNKR